MLRLPIFSLYNSGMKEQILHIILPVLFVALLLGCHSYPKDVTKVQQKPIIWPDYTEVTIPANIAPLNFSMAKHGSDGCSHLETSEIADDFKG